MTGDMFLRQVPAGLQAEYDGGALKIYGSSLRHADGRIAGFLQETSGLSKIAEAMASGPAAPLKLVGDTVRVVQNEQIKGGIARLQLSITMLNQLQLTNLALGAAGIGISTVGFGMISRKIDGVQDEVRALSQKLEAMHADVRTIDLKLVGDRLKQLLGLARSVDSAWAMSDEGARISWRDDAGEARRLQDFFEGRAEQLLTDQPLAVMEATPLLDASAMASALRVGALALAGETSAAITVAQEDAKRLERLTGGIGAADLARAWLALSELPQAPGGAVAGDELAMAITEARAAAVTLRAREAIAARRAGPLMALEAKGVPPRMWLWAARAEEEVALLLLEA